RQESPPSHFHPGHIFSLPLFGKEELTSCRTEALQVLDAERDRGDSHRRFGARRLPLQTGLRQETDLQRAAAAKSLRYDVVDAEGECLRLAGAIERHFADALLTDEHRHDKTGWPICGDTFDLQHDG